MSRSVHSVTIPVYSDPGHSWAKIPITKLIKLGIDQKITPYSYQRNGNAYLEEDCDMTTLINTLKNNGYTIIKFKQYYTNKSSKIRSYAYYTKPIWYNDKGENIT